ncbi:kelch 41 [Paramuricea clavata]|uniref:Kelch 41 n=1 Tax=Paramuricea clavata TaxID=317549 RepID=A0A6S7JSG6_PARCT|nr:kelch 41 [Paramuricea clavata]
MKELCQMPKAREYHGAEVFEDKVLILGGYRIIMTTDSVLEFDPKRNECKEMPKLPSALRRMATVRWRDEVVVLGGRDNDSQTLNDVFMYNSKTGKTALPPMLEKRYNCCAVITGNTIVVMGGIIKDVYPRKPSIVSKYALPVMWKLLESSSSASTGSGNMKEAVHGLANLLYSLMGQSLFEQAQAKSHRLRQKLKELLDQ